MQLIRIHFRSGTWMGNSVGLQLHKAAWSGKMILLTYRPLANRYYISEDFTVGCCKSDAANMVDTYERVKVWKYPVGYTQINHMTVVYYEEKTNAVRNLWGRSVIWIQCLWSRAVKVSFLRKWLLGINLSGRNIKRAHLECWID
jgi:hypothetical protein